VKITTVIDVPISLALDLYHVYHRKKREKHNGGQLRYHYIARAATAGK